MKKIKLKAFMTGILLISATTSFAQNFQGLWGVSAIKSYGFLKTLDTCEATYEKEVMLPGSDHNFKDDAKIIAEFLSHEIYPIMNPKVAHLGYAEVKIKKKTYCFGFANIQDSID